MSDSQYFGESPEVASSPLDIDVALHDLRFVLRTDRGVFARGGLDTGTRFLLDQAPSLPATGNFLDLGCGSGPIALTMALRRPAARVWAVDVNSRARDLARFNADRAGSTNVEVCSPEAVPDTVAFDVIWSNPPIRIGKPALHELLLRWLPRLHPHGIAVLVVSKHLGSDSLARWLTEQGWPTDRLGSRAGSRLLRVAQP
jgi:16S rRNA (guanine1207-N2)-methyltransferase